MGRFLFWTFRIVKLQLIYWPVALLVLLTILFVFDPLMPRFSQFSDPYKDVLFGCLGNTDGKEFLMVLFWAFWLALPFAIFTSRRFSDRPAMYWPYHDERMQSMAGGRVPGRE